MDFTTDLPLFIDIEDLDLNRRRGSVAVGDDAQA